MNIQAAAVLAVVAFLGADESDKPNSAVPWKGPQVPICVNVQNITNAPIYRDAGINTYVGIDDITENPTEDYQFKPEAATLDKLGDLGMYAFVFQDVWGHLKDHPVILGWLSNVDEPDNIQSDGKAVPLDRFLAEAKKIKEFDSTKPYVVCFGQGLINDLFKGRGIDRSEYPKYMEVVDFIQYDVYPITNSKRPDGEKYLELTGQGVSRIRGWTGNAKPVMCWIETTHIKDPDKAPTPAQTNCEVWITMVHGARGVGYFCHDFTLKEKRASALSRDKAMLAQLKKTNAKLTMLGDIIATPLASEPATVQSQGGKVIASFKAGLGRKVPGVSARKDGKLGSDDPVVYSAVLSVNVLGEKAAATIPAKGLTKGEKVEVLGEGRTIVADTDGQFSDEFAPYQEHVYRYGVSPLGD
ncbi:MAG: hypothetical protein JXL80_10645 [Planctomycetes bacterium]|nr:hypothetical protein [Planctomycetota bacterium]